VVFFKQIFAAILIISWVDLRVALTRKQIKIECEQIKNDNKRRKKVRNKNEINKIREVSKSSGSRQR
jgi:hypothetical protein